VTIASTTLFTGGNNSNTTFAGLINDSGSGGRVVKEGTGTFTLSGANSYTSGTIVSNGTLLVNNSSGSGTGSGTVRVAPTAKLGGTGTISGAVTVDAGATLAPGNSPGVLHMNGGLTLASNATFSVEINGPTLGTQYDQADVIGTVALTNSLLQLIMGFSPTPGQQFTIINNDASDAIGGTFAGLPQGSFIDASGLGNNAYFNISYTGGSGNDVVLTATIPEPATLTLLTISGLLVLRRRRR
jgi:autotransporter-associated beta strand protein